MSDERLSDEQVASYIAADQYNPWPAYIQSLAREVQEAREVLPAVEFERNNAEAYVAKLDNRLAPIDALCARHDIDIDGIVRLVDEVMGASVVLGTRVVVVGRDRVTTAPALLRRLARGKS